jgi:UDP-N-acetylglucosamine acyltransferase
VATNTHGGGIDQTAIIGHAPESREWRPGDPAHEPEIDKTARIEAFVTVDAGLWDPTSVGARTWLMKKVHVGHDAVIGSDCELAPGVIVGGHVTIGTRSRLGWVR